MKTNEVPPDYSPEALLPQSTQAWIEKDRQRMLYPFVSPSDKCYLFGTWIVSILPLLALLGMIGVLVGGFLLLE